MASGRMTGLSVVMDNGLTQEEAGAMLSHLAFYEIFALFKTAVVVEQIYVRWVKGQTKDSRFEALGALTPVLAAAAQECISG